jgi:hypothetical protein
MSEGIRCPGSRKDPKQLRHEPIPALSANLLNMTQTQLPAPLAVESRFLEGEIIYLCANEGQAKECENQGKVAYTPDEVRILRAKFKTLPLEDYVKHLRMIHETKKQFPGSRVTG